MFLRKTGTWYLPRKCLRGIITSHYPNKNIEEKNFINYIFQYFDKHKDHTFIIDSETKEKYSFGNVKQLVKNAASKLTEIGVTRGTRVGLVARNSVHYTTLMLAVIGCGAVGVPINPALTAYELQNLLDVSKPKVVFTDSEIMNLLGETKKIDYIKNVFSFNKNSPSGVEDVDYFLNSHDRHCPFGDHLDQYSNEICLNMFSSGTTGMPKAVEITHKNCIACTEIFHGVNCMKTHSIIPLFLPFYHIFGMMIALFHSPRSCSTIISMPTFQTVQFLEIIEKYRATQLYIVPPVALFLANYPDLQKYDLASVSNIIIGAAPLDKVIENRLYDRFLSKNQDFFIGQGYGLSETTGIISVATRELQNVHNKSGSVGKILPNMQLKVVSLNDLNKELGVGEVGEILVKGPNMMLGYSGIDKSDPLSCWNDDWLLTGDIGYYDEDEYLFISDRKKDLIKVKGYQVAPAEIEGLLLSHPSVSDCAVIGVQDEQSGEVPKAYIVKKGEITEADIHQFIAENLSEYKALKGGIEFLQEIPKSLSGKILRKDLRKN